MLSNNSTFSVPDSNQRSLITSLSTLPSQNSLNNFADTQALEKKCHLASNLVPLKQIVSSSAPKSVVSSMAATSASQQNFKLNDSMAQSSSSMKIPKQSPQLPFFSSSGISIDRLF